jgi:divalent metal cation (Fe/Co/Zn/Cd) transporter
MMTLFSGLSVPQLSKLARRTALIACAIGVVVLVVSSVISQALFGVGTCLGLGLAMINFRLIVRATAKAAAAEREHNRRPLATNTLARLGVISVIALGLAWLVTPLGFGVIVGLALFQFALLANVVMTLLRDPSMRETGEH